MPMDWQRLKNGSRRVFGSFLVSMAVLSIANIDTLWQEHIHRGDEEVVREATRHKLRTRLKEATEAAVAHHDPTPMERLRFALTQDELGDLSPFAKLTTLEPLTAMMKLGVAGFQRQAFRSPQYKDEVGYDLVEYEIEHPDKNKSYVLAYLEYPLTEDQAGKPVPVVIVMKANKGAARQAFFRDGELVEEGDLTLAQVQALVAQKLNAGVPFFSVSR